ncbi:MAG TPA: peptide deformylase [Jatrophihabitans sp.]|nr:peptide deformylase [Jatrophihabitans sp.]
MAGTARPVVIVGDPVLHHPTAPVTAFDEQLSTLIEDLFATMKVAEGVGLAANQIGVAQAVFVYDCHDDDGVTHRGHMVNPRIIAETGPEQKMDEGCLSVPGPYASLGRPYAVTVSGQDKHGAPIEITGTGFLARCLVHETEHLQGTLYIDHLNRRKRNRVLSDIEPFPWNGPLPVG